MKSDETQMALGAALIGALAAVRRRHSPDAPRDARRQS